MRRGEIQRVWNGNVMKINEFKPIPVSIVLWTKHVPRVMMLLGKICVGSGFCGPRTGWNGTHCVIESGLICFRSNSKSI